MTPIRTPPAPRTDNAAALTAFKWEPQPEAERLVRECVDLMLHKSAFASRLSERLRAEAGVRLADLVDHVVLPDAPRQRGRLSEAGFEPTAPFEDRNGQSRQAFKSGGGIFPTIVLAQSMTWEGHEIELAIRVESVVDFLCTWQTHDNEDKVLRAFLEEYPPLARVRLAEVRRDDRASLFVVERHGSHAYNVARSAPPAPETVVLQHAEKLRMRLRRYGANTQFAAANHVIDAAITDLGVDYTCDLFFAAEREYWQRRNRAGQIQKARQDRLGIGWANHDHHTYRSSRRHFASLIAVFEKLGFHCRERFYAGREAGWGAQVLEQPSAGIVIFADVDLSPDELMIDFAHEPLPERDRLGTVGLWCALHGESFLEAGMHHLECQFDFNALKQQLESEANVKVMKPFTDFPYLRQAFTEGERWPVRPERIDRLLKDRLITPDQADKFHREGAIGSHLENLERNQGFKGFNQTGVSEIISATDPRKH